MLSAIIADSKRENGCPRCAELAAQVAALQTQVSELKAKMAQSQQGAHCVRPQALRYPDPSHPDIVDHFGNLISNITRGMLPVEVPRQALQIVRGTAPCTAFADTDGLAPPHQLVALIGSSDRLEFALTGGHAAIALGLTVGAPVRISWTQP